MVLTWVSLICLLMVAVHSAAAFKALPAGTPELLSWPCSWGSTVSIGIFLLLCTHWCCVWSASLLLSHSAPCELQQLCSLDLSWPTACCQ